MKVTQLKTYILQDRGPRKFVRAHQTTDVTPYNAAFNPDGSVADI